jgi:hypothetical protein
MDHATIGEDVYTGLMMSEPAMRIPNIDYVLEVDAAYEMALLDEAELSAKLTQAEEKLEVYTAYRLLKAAQEGEIDGKNKDIRERQRTVLLADDAVYLQNWQAVADLRETLGEVKAKRTAIESRLKILRAWMHAATQGVEL